MPLSGLYFITVSRYSDECHEDSPPPHSVRESSTEVFNVPSPVCPPPPPPPPLPALTLDLLVFSGCGSLSDASVQRGSLCACGGLCVESKKGCMKLLCAKRKKGRLEVDPCNLLVYSLRMSFKFICKFNNVPHVSPG